MTAPAFAFLHGGGQGSWVWEATIAELEARSGARCLALDVPGCGAKRSRDTAAITFPGIIDELLADLDAWGETDVVLVGHSQAGTVLPLLAQARPQTVARLVYLACSLPLPGQTVVEMVGSGVHGSNPDEMGWPFDPANSTMAERWAAMFTDEMDADQRAEFRARSGGQQWPMSSYEWRDWRLDAAPAPSTYLLCTRDRAVPPDWQRRFAARLHCARVAVLAADHQAMLTQPEALAEALLGDSRVTRGLGMHRDLAED